MDKPYDEKILNENTRVRTFNTNVSEDHLIWHRDRQDRVVEVIHSNGWLFQRDDSVPHIITPGDILEIGANEWHRIIKGKGDLVLKITERKKKKKKKAKDKSLPKQYGAPKGSKRAEELEKSAELYAKGDVKGAARIRRKMEEPHMAESTLLERQELREMINDITEEIKLDELLKELEQRIEEKKGKSSKGLSKAVKKSLDKKADKRCLTRGSVYSEFRKGLAAFLSSGSRKGMTAHQWAHARVNSAQPSKKWATVKKRKKCPKKKK